MYVLILLAICAMTMSTYRIPNSLASELMMTGLLHS